MMESSRPQLRRITIDQLAPGMYVERLDKSWLLVPIFHNPIASPDQVEKLRQYEVRELVINVAKGIDLPGGASDARQKERSGAETHAPVDPVPYSEEIAGANNVYGQAQQSVSRLMNAVRDGQSPDLALAQAAVDQMIASILRNRDALASLTQLKEFSENTFQHCIRVCILTLVFATRLGFSRHDLKTVGLGALLHDIGKMRLPPEIVDKKAPLSPEEFERYRTHPLLGARLFDGAHDIEKQSLLVLLQHHERADGSGFPQGLAGDEISRLSKMVMIVDGYDDLTTGRENGKKVSPYDAIKWLREWGTQGFDPDLIAEFVAALGLYPAGTFVRLSDNRLGIVVSLHHNPAMLPKIQVVFDAKHKLLPEAELIDLAEQASAQPLTIVSALVPEKLGFDLPGYVKEHGLLAGQLPGAQPISPAGA